MSEFLADCVLRDPPQISLEEALRRAARFVGPRLGIISAVVYAELTPDDPDVHIVHSIPADTAPWAGQTALNAGTAASADPRRAVMKAIGESVERYCSAFYDAEELVTASYAQLTTLGRPAIDPQRFALYSPRQYGLPDFPFTPLTADTRLRWAPGYSLTAGTPMLVPATATYIPYRRDPAVEPRVCDLISTGLACADSYAGAVYRGAMECVERDAFSIVWHHRLACPHVALPPAAARDPFLRRHLEAIDGAGMDCAAVLLTQDLPVPVILAVLTSRTGKPPATVIGMGVDLSPQRALVLAVEEACLGLYGMDRRAAERPDYRPRPPYHDITTLGEHGLAYALHPEFKAMTDFLREPTEVLEVGQLPERSSTSVRAHLRTTIDLLSEGGLELIAVDLTTPDVDEVGFKVVRAVIPGLHPLDNDHRYRYLGGRRLFEVPVRTGARVAPAEERDLNPDPHPFP